jgi:diguanylate cyclase (GGDEF)-like protein/PAS domain S-box-containing protein
MIRTPIRQLRLQLMAAIAVIVVLIWGVVAYQLKSEREAALRIATQNGQNLASVVAGHFSAHAGTIDLWLQHLRIQWLRDRRRFAAAVALEKSLHKNSHVFQVVVTDAQGWMIYSDLARPSDPPLYLGDLEHFKVHARAREDQLYISNPERGRVSARLSIQFARPIFDAKGAFSGVMLLSVSPDVVGGIYAGLDLGPGGIVALRSLDNTLLMRWPDFAEAQPRQLPPIPQSGSAAAEAGSYFGMGGLDGVQRLFSFRRIADFPFYAMVGQPLDSVLADYNGERWVYVAGGSLGSLVVVLLGLVLLSKVKREEQVESRLSDSEQRFRSLTGLASDMYWEQDDRYRFTSSSGGGAEWIVKGRREAVGKRRWDFHYLNMSEADWAAHIALLDARKPFRDLELCRLDESGRKVWASVSGEPVFDPSGTFNGYRGVGKDITERKRAEQLRALEHAVSRSLATADSASAALEMAIRVVCETEGWDCGRYFYVDEPAGVLRFGGAWSGPDEAIERFIAASRDLVFRSGIGLSGHVWQSGQPLWSVDLASDPRSLTGSSSAARLPDIGVHGAFVFPVVAEGKTIGVLNFSSRRAREPEEPLLQAISAIGSQIGQFLRRKQQEEELRRFRVAMDVSADLVLLVDAEKLRYIDVNDAACRALGYSREELLERGPHDIFSITREELRELYRRLIGGDESKKSGEGWYRRKDGTTFPVESVRRAVPSGSGHIIVAVARDITERKLAEQVQAMEHMISRCLAAADSASATLKAVIRAVCWAESWECGRYLRVDEQAGLLRFFESWSVPGPEIERYIDDSRRMVYARGVGLVGEVWQSSTPLWVPDVTQDARFTRKALAREAGMRGALAVPVTAEGKTIGVLIFQSREIREPDERLLNAMYVIGSQVGQFMQRKQWEEELRRFRAGMDVSEDMIWLIDPVRISIIDANETSWRKLGYTREELLRMGPADIIRMSREELSAIYRRLIAGGEGDTVEGWYRRKDGSQFPVEVFRRAVESEGSNVIVAVVRDITARRAAEEELRRFRLAMDNSADMIVLIDRATMRFVDVNETACKLLGYSREELLEMGPQDVLPITREELERSYDSLIANPDANADQLLGGMKSHYVCKDGTPLPFESTRHVLHSGNTHIIAAISRDIRERLAVEEKVAHLAQFDTLTGLPNRNLFQDRLTQAMALAKRNDWPMAVLFIDLDRFKLVNDTLGHGAGDELLKQAAVRLRSCIRASDTVGRLGGDEFATILSELSKPGDAGLVAQKFIDAFKHPFNLDGREFFVTPSIGITLYPADSDNAESLVMNADTAMYRAKERGRNNYQYFTQDMNERALQRVQMEAALRRALERSEFRLFYQPKANLATGEICGFEALLRWQHPDKGMVLPGDFIPVLEETGLIVPAGEWVIRTTCAQIKSWQESGLKVPPVAINLSARQFEQKKNLKDAVRQILRDAEVDPSLIEFEITESLLMNDPQGATKTLRDLRELGVKLSMDDFGTGYSSLGYLKRFPIDTLKIDRTFVRDLSTDPDDATLTRAIINLAQNLRLKVVAEGVETEAQLSFLCRNGCNEMQGYLFAKPTNAEECGRMLRQGRKLAIPRAGLEKKTRVAPARAQSAGSRSSLG